MKRILLLLAIVAFPALAALPPQSPEDLLQQADHVWVGKVLKVERRTVLVSGGTDRLFELKFHIDDSEKGSQSEGTTVTVECRQTGRRLMGWAGPQGQDEIPDQDSTVRLYVTESKGRFSLLEPNGWESTESAP